jgi:hypothetical protein
MPKVEFFHTSNDQPLHFDVEEGRYVWRQYTRGNWYVRVDDPYVLSVFIRVDEEDVPLERYVSDNCFTLSEDVGQRIASGIKRRTGQEPNPGGWVALLDLWSSDGKKTPQRLDPPLYIEPGNLSPDDFDLIIDRLQELAFFRYSPTQVKWEVSGGSTEGGVNDDENELLKQAADKFLALIKQVHLNWPLVQATASRETQLLPGLVDVSSSAGSHSSRLAAKKSQHPYARRVEILMPQESFATVENQFLVYVLQSIGQDSFLFERLLTNRCKELREEWAASEDKEIKLRQAKHKWQKKQTEQQALADCLETLADDIAKAAKEVTPCIRASFLYEVLDRPALPSRPSDRLTRSFAYGPIYSAFWDYWKQPGISFAPLKPGLTRALETRAIHPACTLYELWVFVELYDMLTRTFGFRLPADAPTGHPLDLVDSTAGEVIGDAMKRREFRLELRPVNNQQRVITLSLWYDTEERERHPGESRLRPDVYIEVADSKHGSKSKPLTFAIDANYRSYPGYYYRKERDLHGVNTVFDLDLLVTAKKKYRGRLRCNAAFVVHSDSYAKYTQWGGGPDELGNWPGPEHCYGAVFANPSSTNNLRKLLKCFLMYHMGIENICWACRNEVKEREDLSKSNWVQTEQHDEMGRVTGIHSVDIGRKPVGHDYLCGDCQRSWTRTWCRNAEFSLEDRILKHRILKIAVDNFHDLNQKGTICPTCGDGTVIAINGH